MIILVFCFDVKTQFRPLLIPELIGGLCGGYNNYDSTSIRRLFDCLSKVTRVTVT